jgi:hypothetical protein
MSERRIVVIDNHIIAQWYEIGKWWTLSKANNNTESDFALWPYSESNMLRAIKLFGDLPVVRTDCKPYEGVHGWYTYTSAIAETPMSYTVALLKMASSIR